jgi:hypothetical protein
MADLIEVPFVHLADATTKTQQAKVDAAGNQYAVVTNTVAVSGALSIGSGTAGAAVVGTITQVGTPWAISATLSNAGTITVAVSGNYTQSLAFQASTDNGTSWDNLAGARFDGTGSESVTPLLTNATQAWSFAILGMTNFRVYAVQVNSGITTIRITQETAAYTPNPVVTLGTGSNTIGNVALVDGSGTNAIVSLPTGILRVAAEPTQLFNDSFPGNSSLNTSLWNTPVTGGGGISATVINNTLTLGSGTTAGGYSYLTSQPTFGTEAPSFLSISFSLQIEYPVLTPATRFWGIGTSPGTPTVTSSTTDGVGFELYSDGKMYAVAYVSGVRTVIQDLSAATGNGMQPTDGNYHLYVIYFRTTKMWWYIDNMQTPVATASEFKLNNDQLPMKLSVVAGTTPSQNINLICQALAIGDLAGNNHTLSDGIYPWQKASISPTGTFTALASANSLATYNPITTGTWSYYAGTSGTVVVAPNWRVVGITAHSTSGGTLVINSGQTFPILAGTAIAIQPGGNIVAPTLVFTTTDSYFVEVVN